MKSKMQLLFVFAVVLVVPQLLRAQATSRTIPFNNVATTIAPSTPAQPLTIQLWDAATDGNQLYCENQTLDVDANGAITFNFGAGTAPTPPCASAPPGLNPNDFPSGASRFVDVVDSTNTSVLPNPPGRIPLNAVAFALSPGPQGPQGSQGPPGPPGVVQAVTAGDTSISIGGTPANPTVAVAAFGITNANVANAALNPLKIAGTAATLGANAFVGTQSITGNLNAGNLFVNSVATNFADINGNADIAGRLTVRGNGLTMQIGNVGCGPPTTGIGTFGVTCATFALGIDGSLSSTFINRPTGGKIAFREGNGLDQMTIASGGNVGIGTNTPAARLHVVGNQSITGDLTTSGSVSANSASIAGNGANIFLGNVGCGPITGGIAFGTMLPCNNFSLGFHLVAGGGETVINRPTGGNISFREGNGPDQMTILPGGNATFAGTSSTFNGNVTIRGGMDFAGGIIRQDLSVFGNLNVGGALSVVGRKQFIIDHPLDPANKYLHHAAIESSEVKNMYDGVARLDENGEAVVQLPEWFEALNRDFRYQLTAIGAPAPTLYVAQEISGNRFKIAGGKPGGRVSWQVTGIRQDAYAKAHPMRVEEDKPAADRGYYLSPEVFGQPAEKAIGALRRPLPVPASHNGQNAAPR